ncbi:Regulatory protein TenI [compost metagenome]
MIVISNPIKINNEIDIIHSLFEQGLSLFHVRKPDYSEKEMKTYLSDIKIDFRSQLVLHNHHHLAAEFRINRIHFTEKERIAILNPVAKLTRPTKNTFQKMVKKGLHLSTSVHTIEDFNALDNAFGYAFLSPVYPSISKENYSTKTNLLEDTKKRTNYTTQLIALGGMDSKNTADTLKTGFDDVALLGTIWNSVNPIENFKLCQNLDLSY